VNLGACCSCRRDDVDVFTILMLPKLAPIAGRGWGCVVCGLPADGALAVVCERCADTGVELVDACRGYPGEDGRVPIDTLEGEFEHDRRLHAQDECGAPGCNG
jgi:hypothetical protein